MDRGGNTHYWSREGQEMEKEAEKHGLFLHYFQPRVQRGKVP